MAFAPSLRRRPPFLKPRSIGRRMTPVFRRAIDRDGRRLTSDFSYHNSRKIRRRLLTEDAPGADHAEDHGEGEPAAGGGERRDPVEGEVGEHDPGDDRPCDQRARADREQGGRRAENSVFDQEHSAEAGPRRAEDLQDRRVGEPGAPVGGERAGEHQHGGQRARRRSRRGSPARASPPAPRSSRSRRGRGR